jgi:hypothetical protein
MSGEQELPACMPPENPLHQAMVRAFGILAFSPNGLTEGARGNSMDY